MFTQSILDYLGCPTCGGAPLSLEASREQAGTIMEGSLRCTATHRFPIHSGVPILIDQSTMIGDEWKLWQEHLNGFQKRRERREREKIQITSKLGRASIQQHHFSTFTGIQAGRLLDVGCGPGKFRYCFDQHRVEYVGLDPIVLPDTDDFPFIAGLAEYLPFKTASFTDVTVLAALDHFKDKPAFFSEVRRVLVPGGRFHLLQSIHEAKGLKGTLKYLAHETKDYIESRLGEANPEGVPPHMTEFGGNDLAALLRQFFTLDKEQRYEARLLAPTRMFISMRAA